MTNFDFLQSEPKFHTFADAAIAAEKTFSIDIPSSVINCRRAMEFAVKWMYSVDDSLSIPWNDKLASLMSTEDFQDIVGIDLWRRMEFIRKKGNNAVHTSRKVTKEEAMLCLENLYIFMDFLAYCYSEHYVEKSFNPALLLEKREKTTAAAPTISEVDLDALIKENASLKEKLTARRKEQQQSYVPKPLDISEYATRKMYIDTMLEDAGWIEGRNWLNEVELPGMPNKSEKGYADYVLYGDDGKVLAVIEAKRTCADVSKGRQQAKLYADLIE